MRDWLSHVLVSGNQKQSTFFFSMKCLLATKFKYSSSSLFTLYRLWNFTIKQALKLSKVKSLLFFTSWASKLVGFSLVPVSLVDFKMILLDHVLMIKKNSVNILFYYFSLFHWLLISDHFALYPYLFIFLILFTLLAIFIKDNK